jgi:TPR repeat protein
MPEMTVSPETEDPLAPLWKKAYEAEINGDMPGILFIWKALAEQGVWQLLARIGELYERGAIGVEPNTEQAINWYRRAVYECDDPIGHLGLGRAYYTGIGIQQDFQVALSHFKKAHTLGLPDAAVYLGLMFLRGHGVVRDLGQAEAHFRFAADQSYFVAYYLLARIAFKRGNLVKAAKLFVRGWSLARRILKSEPSDSRLLLGINWSRNPFKRPG